MPMFLITSNSIKKPDTSIFEKYSENQSVIHNNNSDIYCFFNNGDNVPVKINNTHLLVVGVFIYKKCWGKQALELFHEDLEAGSDIKDLLRETRGQFCLVMSHNGNVQVITDKTGAIPVYVYHDGDQLAVSNVFLPLAKNYPVSLNRQWLAQYLSQGNKNNIKNVIFFNKTLANEIDLLEPGTIYSLDSFFRPEQYYNIDNTVAFGKNNDINDVISHTRGILSENLSFLDNEKKLYCDVTGGFDTRTNLAILLDKHLSFDTGNQIPTEYKHLTNAGKYSDLRITEEIRNALNLSFNRFDDTLFEAEKEKYYQMAFDLFSLEEKGWTYPRRLAYYGYLNKKLNENILVSGLFGTELLTDLSFPRDLSGKKEDLKPFIERYYPYLDILKDSYYSKEEYIKNLIDCYAPIFSKIQSHPLHEAGTYIFYETFFLQKFSRYHGNANVLIPTYSPFIEANFITYMIQTSANLKNRYVIQRTIIDEMNPVLGKINTTHGYPASKITFGNFYRFARILYTKEANLQYIGPIDRTILSVKEFFRKTVKNNTFSRNLGLKVYRWLHKNEKFHEFEVSEYEKDMQMIERDWKEMVIFQLVDYEKFIKAVKEDENIIRKISHINRVISETDMKTV